MINQEVFRRPDADPKTGYKKHEPWNQKSYTIYNFDEPIFYAKDPIGNKFIRFLYTNYKRIEWCFLSEESQKVILKEREFLNYLKFELAELIRGHEECIKTENQFLHGTRFQTIQDLERRIREVSEQVQELEDLNVCWFDKHDYPDDFLNPLPQPIKPGPYQEEDRAYLFKVRVFYFERTRSMEKRFFNGPFYKWWTQCDVQSRSWDPHTNLHTVNLKNNRVFVFDLKAFKANIPKDSQLRQNLEAYLNFFPNNFECLRTKNYQEIYNELMRKGFILNDDFDQSTFFLKKNNNRLILPFGRLILEKILKYTPADYKELQNKFQRNIFHVLVKKRLIVQNHEREDLNILWDRWKKYPDEKPISFDTMRNYKNDQGIASLFNTQVPVNHPNLYLKKEYIFDSNSRGKVVFKKRPLFFSNYGSIGRRNYLPSKKEQKSLAIQCRFIFIRTLLSVWIPRLFNKK